jgi:hypothetical protein
MIKTHVTCVHQLLEVSQQCQGSFIHFTDIHLIFVCWKVLGYCKLHHMVQSLMLIRDEAGKYSMKSVEITE